jgi:hypothetical protein
MKHERVLAQASPEGSCVVCTGRIHCSWWHDFLQHGTDSEITAGGALSQVSIPSWPEVMIEACQELSRLLCSKLNQATCPT